MAKIFHESSLWHVPTCSKMSLLFTIFWGEVNLFWWFLWNEIWQKNHNSSLLLDPNTYPHLLNAYIIMFASLQLHFEENHHLVTRTSPSSSPKPNGQKRRFFTHLVEKHAMASMDTSRGAQGRKLLEIPRSDQFTPTNRAVTYPQSSLGWRFSWSKHSTKEVYWFWDQESLNKLYTLPNTAKK